MGGPWIPSRVLLLRQRPLWPLEVFYDAASYTERLLRRRPPRPAQTVAGKVSAVLRAMPLLVSASELAPQQALALERLLHMYPKLRQFIQMGIVQDDTQAS